MKSVAAENASRCIYEDLIDDKSTLIQVMAWCRHNWSTCIISLHCVMWSLNFVCCDFRKRKAEDENEEAEMKKTKAEFDKNFEVSLCDIDIPVHWEYVSSQLVVRADKGKGNLNIAIQLIFVMSSGLAFTKFPNGKGLGGTRDLKHFMCQVPFYVAF